MEMLRHAIEPEQLAKLKAEDEAKKRGVELLDPSDTLPYGNRHERRKAEKLAELEARVTVLK